MTEINVTFWGVRGSIACPGPDYVRYGGNTSCVEISYAGHTIICDAGTGLRVLGKKLMRLPGPVKAHILLSHTHYDHIAGLPFFEPFYNPLNEFTILSGHLEAPHTLEKALAHMMTEPLFPVPLDIFDARLIYTEFKPSDEINLTPGICVKTYALNHPNGATGYRIQIGEHSICYITDTEHPENGIDATLCDFVRNTDMLIYDATYSEKDYPAYKGWGHSTWEAGYALAVAAHVKKYVIFHHNPDYDDTVYDRLSHAIAGWSVDTMVAVEGKTIRI